jgi:hypothetical protein
MGNYNPHAPYILGNEWVPIRDASYVPDQISERGYTFRIDHSAAAVSGAVYVKEPTPKISTNIAEMIHIYPAGMEDKSGPIRRVVIPVDVLNVTGFDGSASGDANSVVDPSDGDYAQMTAGSPTISLNFPIQNYAQQLYGKRILGVRLVYTAAADFEEDLGKIAFGIAMASNLLSQKIDYQSFVEGPSMGNTTSTALILVTDLKYIDFSDINILLTNPIPANSFYDPSMLALPWRYQELLLFSMVTAANLRRIIYIDASDLTGTVFFGYIALEIFYCEETRIRYGGRVSNGSTFTGAFGPMSAYPQGPNFSHLRDVNFAVPSALPAGEYVITTTHREVKPTFIARAAPKLNALRQLYELPSHRGRNVATPVIEDGQFSVTDTDVLPQITLHTASAIVTGVHPYGTQISAPVYSSITAIQEIEDDPVTPARTYQQVRFYARRYGSTTVPLTLTDVATGLSTAAIPVADFDALPEIVDGWREVTLRFAVPPTFSTAAGDVDWRWTAAGEIAGNQWQILGADGPSPTGAQTIGPATYYAPQGTSVALTWKSPSISGTAEDSISDATLIFSQDPPAISGFALTVESQEITGVSLNCGTPPGCIPTGISYISASWTGFGLCDSFERTLVNDWGTTDTGQPWAVAGGTVPDDYDVNSGLGKQTLGSTNVFREGQSSLPTSLNLTGWNAVVGIVPQQVSTGATIIARLRVALNGNNSYETQLNFKTDGLVSLEMLRTVGGSNTTIVSAVDIGAYAAGDRINVRFQWASNGLLQARAWNSNVTEPGGWTLRVTDTSHTSFAQIRLNSRANTSNTNVNPVIGFTDLQIGPLSLYEGAIELQRRDPLTDWQTIMRSTDVTCIAGFNDYEARVGQLSEYRIRTVNVLDFEAPWVTGASATIPSPGVDIGGDASSILIFTSNENPLSNLAYTMLWEGQPVETFTFPEADTVILQRMFGRDYFTAFHPLERGGEQFTRTLLVNAAAIPLPSLANFRRIRDLAWTDLNYVCVRDELGNRWFANIIVPDGSVRLDRTVYMAQIRVSEVTDTPTPVDPGE